MPGECRISIPLQAGAVTGLLTFTDGAGTQTVELTGTGEAAPTDILNPTSLTFPSTAEGQVSAALSVTITNTGDLPLTFPANAVSVSGEFQQSGATPTQIAAHSVGTVSVEFAPTQLGALTGTLTITDALQTQTVSLSGTGVAPGALSVNPASFTFTNQQPGVASAPQTITITNSGGAPMANVGFQITGAAASSYSVPTTTCGALAQERQQLHGADRLYAGALPAPSRPRSLSPRPHRRGAGFSAAQRLRTACLRPGHEPVATHVSRDRRGPVQHRADGHRHQLLELRHRLGLA